MKKYLFITFAFALVFASQASEAEAACSAGYRDSAAVNRDFPGRSIGLPFNVFTATEQSNGTLISTDLWIRGGNCDQRDRVDMQIGNQGPGTTYVYTKGYILNSGGTSWQPVTFSELNSDGEYVRDKDGKVTPWYDGVMRYTANTSSGPDSVYVLAYMCHYENKKWNCGCTDKNCSQSNWQVQRISQ